MNHTLSILLQNESGALVRVAGLFAARGYNIDTLTVAATHDPTVSRLTLSLQCDDAGVAQLLQQTRKLVDVLQVAHPATALAACMPLPSRLTMTRAGGPPTGCCCRVEKPLRGCE